MTTFVALTLADYLTWYLFAAFPPIIFFALFAAFRWRYGRMIRRAIYAASASDRDLPDAWSTPVQRDVPLTLRWFDAASQDGESRSRPRDEARREAHAVQAAFVAAGAAYIAISIVTMHCCNPAGSFLVGYMNSLPALIVTCVFARAGWSVTLAVATSWAALLLLIFANDLGPHAALSIVLPAMFTVAPQLITVGLLLPRTTRTLLVGFVPVFGLLGLLTLAVLTLSRVMGETTEEMPSMLMFAGGALGSVTGTIAAAIAIRRGRQAVAAAVLAAMALGGTIGATRVSPVLAVVGSTGVNGLLTLVAWWAIGWFVKVKQRGVLPDEMLHFMICLLVPTIFPPAGGDLSASLWLPFAGSIAVLWAIASLRRHRARRVNPKRMLLLRVFGPARIRNWLLDALDDTWRRVGTVDLVVGLDVALRTMSALSLENFLLGRAHRQFLAAEPDVRRHLDTALSQRPALDGRYPLNEWYCLPDIWPHVVDSLARAADVVLMDLRGFGEANRGVMFELSLLMRRVPLERVVFLADARTDQRVLSLVLRDAGTKLPLDSPNAGAPDLRVDVLRCSGAREADADAVANALFAAAWKHRMYTT